MASAGFDRNATLDEAQVLVRQGKVEAAIAAYRDLVEHDPQDWNSANVLGDLLLKAGQIDQAIVEYTRVAEHFAEGGFTARASAMYKKVLRAQPDNASAVERAAQLADLRAQKSDCISLLKRVLESTQPDSELAAEASARLAQVASIGESTRVAREAHAGSAPKTPAEAVLSRPGPVPPSQPSEREEEIDLSPMFDEVAATCTATERQRL